MNHWYDSHLHIDGIVPSSGRVLLDDDPTPDLWELIRTTPYVTWLINTDGDISGFLDTLPDWAQPATLRNPTSGLPPNVWVGANVEDWEDLLRVRSKVRFLIANSCSHPGELRSAMNAWRCSNCGHRGASREPRPKTCPHANHLCGDAKLLPQIHWVVGSPHYPSEEHRRVVESSGASYWPDKFPNVR